MTAHELEKLKEKLKQELRAEFMLAPNRTCLNYREASVWIGCSESSIREYERQGKLIARYPMCKQRFHPDDLERFMRGFKARKAKKA